MRSLSVAALALAAALAGCRGTEDACPVRCGDRCLPASACVDIVCPDEAPCDPCTGQCRARCDAATPCKDPAETCCAGACVDPLIDEASCGGCGIRCGADGDRCSDGACACGEGPACGAGMLCCGGACIASDPQNCGACGASCGDGEICDLAAGGCRCGSRVASGAACLASEACCGATCQDVTADPQNCGACGRGCGANVACKDGRCDCTMAGCQDPTQTCCAGGCAGLATEETDCGACGVACGAGELCTGGACTCTGASNVGGPACAAGKTCCPGGCFDLQISAANCGVCGRTCDANTTTGCMAGACKCKTGYAPHPTDPTKCVDVNECATMNGGCLSIATCTNTPGGRTCTCPGGYSGNGVTACNNINECAFGGGNMCSAYAICTDTTPGYTCACGSGFAGNGFVCNNINECTLANQCKVNSTCFDTIGSYDCICNPYYYGNGRVRCCQGCTFAPPRAGLVPQTDPSPVNSMSRTTWTNNCGDTRECGDTCHNGFFCVGATCVQYRCSCDDSYDEAHCAAVSGQWAGGNCCHIVAAAGNCNPPCN